MKSSSLTRIAYLVSAIMGACTTEALAVEPQEGERKSMISSYQTTYLPQISMGGFYGTESNSYGSLDFFLPLMQSPDRLMFVDIRGLLREHPQQEYNLGAGYRWLNADATQLYGAYAFFDRKQSSLNNLYNQITLGGEWKLKDWGFGGNVYIPLGSSKNVVSSAHSSGAEVYQNNKFIIGYQTQTDTEYAMHGFDIEASYNLPSMPALTARLGGFYFNHQDTKAIVGPRAGLSYDFAPLLGASFNQVTSLSLESSYQYDNSRYGIFYAGVQLTVSLGSQTKRSQGLQKAMTDFVRRDLDVVVNKDTYQEYGQLLKADGSLFVGQIVSSEAELTAATTAGSGIDLIGVKGQISLAGNAYGDANTEAAVRLLQGQSITGGNFTYTANGVTHTTAIVNSPNGVSGADPTASNGGLTLTGANGSAGHLLGVYVDNSAQVSGNTTQRIQDLVLRVPEGNTTAGQSSAAITNMTGQLSDSNNGRYSFGHVIIDNVNSNGAFAFATTTNRTGQVTIQNSTINVVNPISNVGAINLVSVGQEDLQINSIDNNEISAVSDATQVTGIGVSWLNGTISDNHFTNISTTATTNDATAIAIDVSNDFTGSVLGNTFSTIESTSFKAYGINIANDMSGQIKNNTFTRILSTDAGAVGINISYDTRGEISNNTFSYIYSVGSSSDLVMGITGQNILSTANIKNNLFTVRGGALRSGGIYAKTLSNSNSITGNTFELSTTNPTKPIGITLTEITTGTPTDLINSNFFYGNLQPVFIW